MRSATGLSESGVHKCRRRFGNAAEAKVDGRVRIFMPEWGALYWGSTQPAEDSDLEPNAGTSPWLEEYRKQRAKREKLKYEQEAGMMLPIDDVNRSFGRVATPLREALHRLCDECRPQIDTALDDAERELDDEFGAEEPEGGE